MPRKSRIDAPAAVHHVIVRGIERQKIFKDHEDYDNFLTRLGDLLLSTGTSCYAFSLLSNHVHLLLRTGSASLSTLMRRLLTGYAVWYNRRYRRHGHLFQNRYKSFLCEETPYLLELVRYIHLNPLRAGMVKHMKELDRFSMSGHAALMNIRKNVWQDTAYVLSLFSSKPSDSRRAYRIFIERGICQGKRPDLVGGGLLRSHGGWLGVSRMKHPERVMSDERILGSSAFVASVLKQAHENYTKKAMARAKGATLNDVVQTVADHINVDATLIRSSIKRRSAVRARSLACALAIDMLGISGLRLAAYLGLTSAAVSNLAAKGRSDTVLQELRERILTSDGGESITNVKK